MKTTFINVTKFIVIANHTDNTDVPVATYESILNSIYANQYVAKTINTEEPALEVTPKDWNNSCTIVYEVIVDVFATRRSNYTSGKD